MKQLLLISLIALLSSCDLQYDDEKEAEVVGLNEYVIGQNAKPTRSLNDEEVRVGGLICAAFATMRNDVYPSMDLSYKISEKNCNGIQTSPVTVAAKIISDGGSTLSREGDVHFRDVLSDKHALLTQMCQNIENNGRSVDTVNLSSDRKIQVHFKTLSNRYYIQIFDFNKNVLNMIHTALVATKDTANSYEGMVITRGLSKNCNNSRSVYSYTQELAL